MLLGLEAPEAELDRAFRTASGQKLVKGFAIGRTIFNDAAREWLGGKLSDAAATEDMAGRFGRLVELWNRTRAEAGELEN